MASYSNYTKTLNFKNLYQLEMHTSAPASARDRAVAEDEERGREEAREESGREKSGREESGKLMEEVDSAVKMYLELAVTTYLLKIDSGAYCAFVQDALTQYFGLAPSPSPAQLGGDERPCTELQVVSVCLSACKRLLVCFCLAAFRSFLCTHAYAHTHRGRAARARALSLTHTHKQEAEQEQSLYHALNMVRSPEDALVFLGYTRGKAWTTKGGGSGEGGGEGGGGARERSWALVELMFACMVSYASKGAQQESPDTSATTLSAAAAAINDALVSALFWLQTGLFIRNVSRELDAYVRKFSKSALCSNLLIVDAVGL